MQFTERAKFDARVATLRRQMTCCRNISQEGFGGFDGFIERLLIDDPNLTGELDEVSEVLLSKVGTLVDERSLFVPLFEVGEYWSVVVVEAL